MEAKNDHFYFGKMSHSSFHTEHNNVRIEFPYKPYDVQVDYMKKVIDSCSSGNYALLESPTGTGKTLSLLCSTLSWKRDAGFSGSIVYTSRTHSQLHNVVSELKKTNFRPRIVHVASRSLLCINEDVNKLDNNMLIRRCHELKKGKSCRYALDDHLEKYSSDVLKETMSFEEYKKICSDKYVCPYYCSQINFSRADIALAPYQYIADPRVRSFLPNSMLENCVLLFDEAHNLTDFLTESASEELRLSNINSAVGIVSNMTIPLFTIKSINETHFSSSNINELRFIFRELNDFFSKLTTNDSHYRDMMLRAENSKDTTVLYCKKSVDYLYNILGNAGIKGSTISNILKSFEYILDNYISFGLGVNEFIILNSISNFLTAVFPGNRPMPSSLSKYFGVCYTSDFRLCLLCFSPKPCFDQLIGLRPKSIILTSGTLAPLKSIEADLGYSFPVQIECSHVAKPEQVLVAICTQNQGCKFDFRLKNRNNNKDLDKKLAESITELITTIPYGNLIFFPSFSFLQSFEEEHGHNLRRAGKQIFVEPRSTSSQPYVLNQYKNNCAKGAVMLAVCRGKLSEGLDFGDEYSRGVSIVGIPFPNVTDYAIELKRQWLDDTKSGLGGKWYVESAIRAVNQAIGRAIRHKDDFAVVVLLDERYAGFKGMLSKWTHKSIKIFNNWRELLPTIESFIDKSYKNCPSRMTQKHRSVVSYSLEKSKYITKKDESDPSKTEKPAENVVPPKLIRKNENPIHLIKRNDTDMELAKSYSLKDRNQKNITSTTKELQSFLTSNDISKAKKQEESPVKSQISALESLKKRSKEIESQKREQESEVKKYCIFCKEKDNLEKLKCGHYICQACKTFRNLSKTGSSIVCSECNT